MTPEEAGELILKGEPWEVCSVCKGCGGGLETRPAGNPQLKCERVNCRKCFGKGHTLPLNYLEACAITGHELSSAPATRMVTVIVSRDERGNESVAYYDPNDD